VVLKLFSLRRLWKNLLDLRRTSNMSLIDTFVIIKVLFIEETTKNVHHQRSVWTCLFLQTSSNLGRVCETATPIFLSRFSRGWYMALITAMAKNPDWYKCDFAKGITIRSAFFAKTGHSSLNEIQINLSDFLSWTIFLGKYCITGKVSIVFLFLLSKGRWCRLDKRISNPFTAW